MSSHFAVKPELSCVSGRLVHQVSRATPSDEEAGRMVFCGAIALVIVPILVEVLNDSDDEGSNFVPPMPLGAQVRCSGLPSCLLD